MCEYYQQFDNGDHLNFKIIILFLRKYLKKETETSLITLRNDYLIICKKSLIFFVIWNEGHLQFKCQFLCFLVTAYGVSPVSMSQLFSSTQLLEGDSSLCITLLPKVNTYLRKWKTTCSSRDVHVHFIHLGYIGRYETLSILQLIRKFIYFIVLYYNE